MKKILHIIIISFVSLLIFISCFKKEESRSSISRTASTTTDNSNTTTDTTAPTLFEVTAVMTRTNDTTLDYIFSSTEAGTITYPGSRGSSTTAAAYGNNTVTISALSDAT